MEKNFEIQSFFHHFPASVAEYCFQLWQDHPFTFVVSKTRSSKLGDYRYQSKAGHRISVNQNLNSYAFLVTYLHEVAHLLVYQQYKNKAKAHGPEWKTTFRELFEPILDEALLPPHLVQALQAYLKDPAASSCGCGPLMEVLRDFDPPSDELPLEQLPEGTWFQIKNLTLCKRNLRRSRYLCESAGASKRYLVSKHALVKPCS